MNRQFTLKLSLLTAALLALPLAQVEHEQGQLQRREDPNQ